MYIVDDVADGYLLECNCGTHLSCRHGHGVIECAKCARTSDTRHLERRVPADRHYASSTRVH